MVRTKVQNTIQWSKKKNKNKKKKRRGQGRREEERTKGRRGGRRNEKGEKIEEKKREACRVHWEGGREEGRKGLVSISADTVSGISARLVRAASDERRNLQKSAADRDKSGRPMFAN